MKQERYTDRAKTIVQAAQQEALANDHQQFTPLHLLKALLEDQDGLTVNLITKAGGNAQLIGAQVSAALSKIPKVSGSGAGQLYIAPDMAKLFKAAEEVADKAGDKYLFPGEKGACSSRP